MRLIEGSSCALFVFIFVVSARPNAPSTSQGVEENGAKTESSISTTNRYRQNIDLINTPRALRNSKIHDFNKQYSDQTEWLPISSSSQNKKKIKIRKKYSSNMLNFMTEKANSLDQSTARTSIDEEDSERLASNTIKTNPLGLNVVSPKESLPVDNNHDTDDTFNSLGNNPFEKTHISYTDTTLVESFVHNTLPDLKSAPSDLIIHPKFPSNTNSSNKYFENNNQHSNYHHWENINNQWNSHKNQYIIVEDVDPAYLPKPPPPPPQPPWYENHKPPETWYESSKPKPEIPSVVFHSEVTYFPPDPEPEPEPLPPEPEPSPEYSYIPIPRPEHHVTSPEPVPEYNYYPSYTPEPNPEPEHHPPSDQYKPAKPVYDDPVFVEPNTPIFITPVTITNIQNNPLNPITATNGKPPPSIVVLDDLSVADEPPAGSGLDASIGTTLTGSMTLGDPGSGGAGSGAGAGSGGAGAAAAAGGAGAAAAAAASSAAIAGGITGGIAASAATGSTAMCNNIQVNTFTRQGVQCPPVNINLLNSADAPPEGVSDDDPTAQAPVQTEVADSDGGVIFESISLFEYLASLFGAINVFNPVGFMFWSLMFAPLSILLTSGLGAVAFFFPWLFPRLWLGRSLRSRRSIQNETDLLFFLNNRLNYDLDYLERLLLTMESNRQKSSSHLKNLKKRKRRK